MSLPHRLSNLFQHCISIREHVVVPEAKHPVTPGNQEGGSSVVRLRLSRVVAPINLHHDPALWAAEVGDELTDGMLAPELGILHLPGT